MRSTHSRLVGRLRLRSVVGLLGLLGLVALGSGCGDEDGTATGAVDETVSSTVVVDDTTSGTEEEGSSATSADDGDATDPSDPPATDGRTTVAGGGDPLPDDELPGDAFEGFAREGDELTVVGVAHDDVLNVRRGPGTDFPVVAELAPVGETVVATGRGRLLTRSLWYEIEVGPVVGWASAGFLAFPGVVDDVTATVVDDMGERAGAETMLDLGRAVATSRASQDVESRITMAVPPEVGDLGEVTYDVIGVADDAVLGYRLHVFATPAPGGERFTLDSVEQTVLCSRGVDADGRCL